MAQEMRTKQKRQQDRRVKLGRMPFLYDQLITLIESICHRQIVGFIRLAKAELSVNA